MKNLSFSALLLIVLALFASVRAYTDLNENKHHHKHHTHHLHNVVTKKVIYKTLEKTHHVHHVHTTKTHATKPTHVAIPGYDYVPPVKVNKENLHIVETNDASDEKNESSKTGTFTFVGLALVAVAAGGISYRGKAKKQLESTELFKYKLENSNIYDNTPKNASLTYSFNPSDFFKEEEARINIYENENLPYNSKRNSGSISTEVIYEDAVAEETQKFNIVTLPTNRAYKAVLPWDARCVDEIQLNCGDLVCIKECYQDGYSLGRNLTTRFDGVFPTCCLANMGSPINQSEVNKWQSVGMYSLPKRSVKPTKKAKRASRGVSLLAIPDWTKKLESLRLEESNSY